MLTYTRCFYVEPVIDKGNQKWRYYIAGYQDGDGGNFKNIRTAVQFKHKPLRWSDKWKTYELFSYENIKIDESNPGYLGGHIWERYINKNEVCQYLKKLDEIAFYSKVEYPYIDRFTDPGEPGAKQEIPWDDLPYPQSYRRVNLRYNYELAKNTPNSKAGEIKYENGKVAGFNGGRLTLKEVRMEAGPESASVPLPPYLFSYNGVDTLFEKFDKVDAWGMRIDEETENFYKNSRGINWNLSEVFLPSCGSFKIEYERDRLDSHLSTIHKMKQRNCFYSAGIIYEENPADIGEYYLQKNVIDDPVSFNGGNVLTIQNVDSLETGMYFVLCFYDHNSKLVQTNYTYRIEGINTALNKITTDSSVRLSLINVNRKANKMLLV